MSITRFTYAMTLTLASYAGQVTASSSFIATEHYQVKIETVAKGLGHPWGLAFLPDGQLLVTERNGKMRLIKDGKLSAPIQGLPEIAVGGQGGLLDVLLDKNFSQNRQIYFSYSEPGQGGSSTAVAKATLTGNALENVKVVFSQQPKVESRHHFGGRLVQQADGHLFIGLGDRGNQRDGSQQLTGHIGKVIRIDTNGEAAKDNPFVKQADAQASIWSYGHRNIQGATLDAQGRLWTHEHGPQGGDEINIAQPGLNYGWPVITYGEEYGGGVIGKTAAEGMEQPLHLWTPSIAPSGMSFYQGTTFPKWQQNLLIGSLKFGQLVRLEVKDDKVMHEERIQIGKRIRDVRTAPDGTVYLLTDENNGSVLKLSAI